MVPITVGLIALLAILVGLEDKLEVWYSRLINFAITGSIIGWITYIALQLTEVS